jgi:hypothetical protein
MKTLLAILLSFIVTEAPVLAIHGGYTLGGAASVMGTYAGVFVPTQDTILTTGSNNPDFGSNSLGLFTLGIPDTGLGTGEVYLFASGQQLVGTIQGLANPDANAGIVGVIQATGQITTASAQDTLFGFNQVQNQITGQASGGMNATVTESTQSVSTAGINISGTANITITSSTTSATVTDINGNTTGGVTQYIPTEAITYAVEGYQQSDYAAPTTTTTTQ